jgi:hypothetical protein
MVSRWLLWTDVSGRYLLSLSVDLVSDNSEKRPYTLFDVWGRSDF